MFSQACLLLDRFCRGQLRRLLFISGHCTACPARGGGEKGCCACEYDEEEPAKEKRPLSCDEEGFLMFGNQSVSQPVKSKNDEENKNNTSLQVDTEPDRNVKKSERIDQNKHSDAPSSGLHNNSHLSSSS